MQLDLVCPSCLHDAGLVEFDAAARGACPSCGVALKIETNVQPVELPEPPARQLALRAKRPRGSRIRSRQDGDHLVTWQRSWLLFFFTKRVELGPDGYAVRTWRKRGSTRMLSEMRGFVMLQRCLDMTMSPIHLMWVSHAVWRGADGIDLYGPIYAHGSYDDGAYYCSLLNAHLATLRRTAGAPYR